MSVMLGNHLKNQDKYPLPFLLNIHNPFIRCSLSLSPYLYMNKHTHSLSYLYIYHIYSYMPYFVRGVNISYIFLHISHILLLLLFTSINILIFYVFLCVVFR